jgi:signal transduction histidine kinase
MLRRAIRYSIERHNLLGALGRSRDRLRLLAARLQNLREDEATRITREFHDVVGQKLTALKMDLHWVERRLSDSSDRNELEAIKLRVADSKTMVDDVISVVQKIAFDLRPSSLDHLGLLGAIREEARRFTGRTGVSVTLNVPDTLESLSIDLATTYYRIFQELLTNVARHANASCVDVDVFEEDANLVLRFADNGVGMDLQALEASSSLGVLGMQDRVASYGGQIEFSAADHGGTKVIAMIPRVVL